MKTILAASAILLLTAQAVHAQQTSRWTVTPVIGSYVPVSSVGAVAVGDGESGVGLRTDASPLLGVRLERSTPGARLALRTQLLFAPSTGAVAQRHIGQESCGENCFRMLYRRESLASGSTALGTVDVLFRPAESWRVRPYVAAGAGLRRFDVDDSGLDPTFAEAFTRDRTNLIGHLGVGVAVRARRAEIRAEIGDYFGRYSLGDGPHYRSHGLSTTVGLSLPVF